MKKLCLALLLAVLLAGCGNVQGTETTDPITEREWTPIYNSHVCGLQVQWSDSLCTCSEELTKEQAALFLPEKEIKDADISAAADFKKDGSVLRVKLFLKRADTDIIVVMGNDAEHSACCLSLEADAKPSVCGDVSYVIYEKDTDLLAQTTIHDLPVTMRLPGKNTQENKDFFEEVLECFSWYGKGKPTLVLEN